MNNVLYEHLRQQFYRNNHPKYRKYFEEWISNITESQISYFEIERINIINKSKYKNN